MNCSKITGSYQLILFVFLTTFGSFDRPFDRQNEVLTVCQNNRGAQNVYITNKANITSYSKQIHIFGRNRDHASTVNYPQQDYATIVN